MKTTLVLCLIGALPLTSPSARGATPFYEEVFANIGEGDAGTIVNGRLIQAADGHFYGTTQQSEVQAGGNVFRLTQAGKLTAFHAFFGSHGDYGFEPRAGLALGPDGSFYGSKTQSSANGARFKLDPTNKIKVLGFNVHSG